MYLVYIRPLLEYACEVWDDCGIGYSDKLEKIQLDAARIVTGLPIFTKSEYLYAETGWETLSERRYRRKLQLFFYSNMTSFNCFESKPVVKIILIYDRLNL